MVITARRSIASIWKSLGQGMALDDPASVAAVSHADFVRGQQARLLLLQSLVYPVTGIWTCANFDRALGGSDPDPILAASAALAAVYVAIVANAVAWLVGRRTPAFLWIATVLYGALGLCWGVLLDLYAARADVAQYGSVIGLTLGVVATSILSVPLRLAVAFMVPVSTLGTLVMVATQVGVRTATVTSYLSFVVLAYVVVVFANRTLVALWAAKINLLRENETTSVFLREYEERSADWLWELDAGMAVRQVGRSFLKTGGLGAEAVIGRGLLEILTPEEGEAAGRGTLPEILSRRSAFRDQVLRMELAGGTRWFSLTGRPVFDRDGRFAGYLGIGSDVTASRESSARIRFLAERDELTGLLNRRATMQAATALGEAGRGFAVVMLDLDGFKAVNDTYGHGAGDRVLEIMARRLDGAVREGDVAGRTGGDEFALLLPGADIATAGGLGARLIEDLNRPCAIGAVTAHVGASIGVAVSPGHGESVTELFRAADLALYRAKRSGKGAVQLFTGSMEEEYRLRVRKPKELEEALRAGKVYVAYQPVRDLLSRSAVAAEALVRWEHPTLGRIDAGAFMSDVENTSVIGPLGEFVLRTACARALHWPAEIRLNVNLSPRQLRTGSFARVLREVLRETGFPPARLALEVTETLFLARSAHVLDQIADIKRLGVSIVLDDFGIGYSSLGYLQDIDVDGIKIDRAFVRDIACRREGGREWRSAAIVRTVARLAYDLNLFTVAEGVEREEQAAWLLANGIPFGQGYLLGRPETRPEHGFGAQDLAAGAGLPAG